MHRTWPTLEFYVDWDVAWPQASIEQKPSKGQNQFRVGERHPTAGMQSAVGPGVMRTPPPGGQFSGISCPRCFEFQRENKILIGIQAQKKGRQISELWEVVGVGLWLLVAQAAGEQSEGADTRKET